MEEKSTFSQTLYNWLAGIGIFGALAFAIYKDYADDKKNPTPSEVIKPSPTEEIPPAEIPTHPDTVPSEKPNPTAPRPKPAKAEPSASEKDDPEKEEILEGMWKD